VFLPWSGRNRDTRVAPIEMLGEVCLLGEVMVANEAPDVLTRKLLGVWVVLLPGVLIKYLLRIENGIELATLFFRANKFVLMKIHVAPVFDTC